MNEKDTFDCANWLIQNGDIIVAVRLLNRSGNHDLGLLVSQLTSAPESFKDNLNTIIHSMGNCGLKQSFLKNLLSWTNQHACPHWERKLLCSLLFTLPQHITVREAIENIQLHDLMGSRNDDILYFLLLHFNNEEHASFDTF